jgi:hypothetical protein
MARRRGLELLIALLLVAGIASAGVRLGGPLHKDYVAGRSLKPLLSEGRRLVPVRDSTNLRGERAQDFHCFSDGQCFYAIDRFRRLYPAYNDLDDDVLLHEIRQKQGTP